MIAPPCLKPAGPSWCAALYPGSILLTDLQPEFMAKVVAFLAALTEGGVLFTIAATYRPPERAYLMHNCCMIAAGQDPAAVAPFPGVEIDWTCGGEIAVARAMAKEMMAGYGITYPAALVSRHTQGLAIDMHIDFPSMPARPFKFKDAKGKAWMFGPGDTASLYTFGATFGVIKLKSDPAHWSSDGH